MISSKKEKNQPISVYVRVRPASKTEIAAGPQGQNVIEITGKAKNERELKVRSHASEKLHKSFTFDRVFGPNSKQVDIFKTVAQHTVAEIIAGYNCTVFAYGQTGTGKTYTMAGGSATDSLSGKSWEEEIHTGVIPRTLAYLFDELRILQIEYNVRVSYLELYNEDIFDLLSPLEDYTKLKLFDDSTRKGSVIVQGLTEVTVNSKLEVFKILDDGAEKRRTASTLMNAQSSRSHTIFTITVHSKESTVDGEDLLKTGKLNLVDLAGSENVGKSGVTDKRVRETCSINTSLLTLGRCIVALTEHRAHVPYRESKLTRLLRDSLGGRTKTSLIATISPALSNLDETLSTLDYASRARNITNKPEMNQRLTKNALLKEYGDQIDRLRKDLQATRLCNGIYLAQENYSEMVHELEVQKEEIGQKINLIRALKEEMDHKEQLCNELQFTIEEHKKVANEKEKIITDLETQLNEASHEITSLQIDKEEKEYLVEKHAETGKILHQTAVKLLNVADVSTSDATKLHTKIDSITTITKQNKQLCEQYTNELYTKINNIQTSCGEHLSHQEDFMFSMNRLIEEIQVKQTETRLCLHKLIGKWPKLAEKLNSKVDAELYNNERYRQSVSNAQHSLTEAIGSRCTDYQESLQDIFDNNIKTLACHLKSNSDAIVETLNLISEKVNEETRNNLTKLHTVQTNLYIFKTEMESRIDKVAKTINKIQMEQLKTALAEDVANKQMEEDLTIAMNAIRQARSRNSCSKLLSKMRAKDTIEHCMDAISLAQQSQYSCNMHVLEESELVSSWEDDINEFKTNCDDQIIAGVDHAQIGSKTTDKCIGRLTNALEELSSGHIKQLKAQVSSVNRQIDRHLETTDITVNKHIKLINSLQEDLRSGAMKEMKVNDECLREITPVTSQMTEMISVQHTDAQQHKSNVCMELNGCREDFKKLLSSEFREYQPTGVTPLRKKYKYPKSVPPTLPNESLLEEFRKSKTAQSLIEEDENSENSYEDNQSVKPISKIPIARKNVEHDGHETDPDQSLQENAGLGYHMGESNRN